MRVSHATHTCINTAGRVLPLTIVVMGATVYRRIESHEETCPPVNVAEEAAVWLTHSANGTRISCLS